MRISANMSKYSKLNKRHKYFRGRITNASQSDTSNLSITVINKIFIIVRILNLSLDISGTILVYEEYIDYLILYHTFTILIYKYIKKIFLN